MPHLTNAVEIQIGRDEAGTDDRSTLKRCLIENYGLADDYDEYGPIVPSLRGRPKTEWGFKHPGIGPLITPIGSDWDDDLYGFTQDLCRTRKKLQQPAGIKISLTRLRKHLWKGREPDTAPRQLYKGFLEGDLLLKARHVCY